jgi:hypothetical protein
MRIKLVKLDAIACPTCDRLVTLPRKELLFSLSGEVGAEVVRLEGRPTPPPPVMSAPSREVELGMEGPSRGVTFPSLNRSKHE